MSPSLRAVHSAWDSSRDAPTARVSRTQAEVHSVRCYKGMHGTDGSTVLDFESGIKCTGENMCEGLTRHVGPDLSFKVRSWNEAHAAILLGGIRDGQPASGCGCLSCGRPVSHVLMPAGDEICLST